MEWDNCLPDDTSIAEILYNQHNKVIKITENDGFEYLSDDNNFVKDDKNNSYITNFLKISACAEITERMCYWQESKDDDFLKNQRIIILNKVYKYICNDNKLKKIIKEMRYLYD